MINKLLGMGMGLVLAALAGCATKRSSGEVDVRPARRPGGVVVQSAQTNQWSTDWHSAVRWQNFAKLGDNGFCRRHRSEGGQRRDPNRSRRGTERHHLDKRFVADERITEIELDAMKVQGSDFFCGLTFPVRNVVLR